MMMDADDDAGTEYVVDQLQGNCTISPLTTTPDVGHVAKDPVLLRINSAKEMFQMTGNYTYVGVVSTRALVCVCVCVRCRGEREYGYHTSNSI